MFLHMISNTSEIIVNDTLIQLIPFMLLAMILGMIYRVVKSKALM